MSASDRSHRSTWVAPLMPPEVTRSALRRARARRRRRTILLIVISTVCALVLGAAGTAAAVFLRATDGLAAGAISRPGEATDAPPQIPTWDGPVNLLILGSDGRDGLTSGQYGDDDIVGDRSDTLMLLHVDAAHENATLVSIPRDTMLPRPECMDSEGGVHGATDAEQVNAAFDVGPYCTLDTIRAYTGLDIDHFVVVNFDGFIGLTDAIGGVEVCLAEDVDDPDSQLHLAAGMHTVQGAQALAFVRTRYGIGDGSDLGRIHTQQAYLAALARKVKSAEILTDPAALFRLADVAGRTLRVDRALSSPGAIVGLAATLTRVALDRMVLVQLPVRDYAPDPNRVEPVPDEAERLFAALREDRPVVLGGGPSAAEHEGIPQDGAADAPEEAASPATNGAPSIMSPGVKGQTADRPACAGG